MNLLLQILKIVLAQQTEQGVLIANFRIPSRILIILILLEPVLRNRLTREVIYAAAQDTTELHPLPLMLLVLLGRLHLLIILVGGRADDEFAGPEVHVVAAA